jgi:hypothetical protein
MKTTLAALAVAMLATGLFASPAQARCWWNGYRTVCDRNYPGWWNRQPPGWDYRRWQRQRWCYEHPYRCR